MNAVETIARHDLIGSNIFTQTYRGKVKRVVARDNELVNETWISDRDRFSYEGLNHESRALYPKIKKNNKWQETSWEVALDFAIGGLKKNAQNANQLGVLASKNSTLEEYYLMQKLARGFGSENIDYRLDKADLSNGNTMLSNISLSEMESIDHALIVNSYLRLEQPMINHRIRKATLNGASVNTINNKKFDFNYRTDLEILSSPQKTLLMLQSILKSLHDRTKTPVPKHLSKIKVEDSQNKIADDLIAAERPVIILGEHVNSNIFSSDITSIISEIAALANAKIANLSHSGNSLSAEKVGFKPSNKGKNAISMFTENTKAFLLMDVDFNYDFINPKLAADTFNNDDVFVISLTSFEDEIALMNSDVILPLASFYESSGTHINFDGVAQSFSASVKGSGDSKPGWKIIKVLADILELKGFEYTDSTQVADDALSMSLANNDDLVENNIKDTDDSKVAVHWQYSPYAIDGITRKAKALQETPIGKMNDAFISLATAKELNLSEGDLYHGVPVSINETVAEGCVFVHTYQSRKG
jgi:NADH-quinone oxidoreductase subunit G